MLVDLETVDPRGRVDVLAYRGAEYLVNKIEAKYGISGVWDNVKPVVNGVVSKHLSDWEIPGELKILLGILQANYQPQVKE